MKFDLVKKLHQKKYRQQSGYCLLEGEHLVDELFKTDAGGVELWLTEEHQTRYQDHSHQVLNQRQMSQLSDTRSPQGVLASVPITELLRVQQVRASDGCRSLYLYEIQDPGNLGTILRTLAWFGGWRCLLGPNSVDPFNSKVLRASMGAIFHVPLELDVEVSLLADRFSRIAILDMDGKPIQSQAFAEHDCYLFGNEARGVPSDLLATLKTETFSIPGQSAIESLNLGTAVSTCVYELARPSIS